MAKNEVATVADAALPAHLQNRARTSRVGNIDQSDIIIPRVKLLQAISPELTDFETAKAGTFWHSIAEEALGQTVDFIPIVIRKSYALWAPRGDPRGNAPLARADDGIHWNVKEDFEVKPKGAAKPVIWSTKAGTVAASGLDQFGTMIPGDSGSQPAATLQYNILAYLVNQPDLSPVLILNARSAVKPCKKLISKLELGTVDHYGRVITMGRVQEQGAEGPYWNYTYTSNGFANAEQFEVAEALYNRYKDADYRASDEGEDTAGGEKVDGKVGGAKSAF